MKRARLPPGPQERIKNVTDQDVSTPAAPEQPSACDARLAGRAALAAALESAAPVNLEEATLAALDPGDVTGAVAALAALDPLSYDRVRTRAAKKLRCRVATLDRRVEAERGSVRGENKSPLSLPEPDPWPTPVDGPALFEEIARAIRAHVVMAPEAAETLALWGAFAHAFDKTDPETNPRLRLTSPEKRSGKTRTLETLEPLVPRPLATCNVSPSALFRVIETCHPTLFVDEADTFVAENEELRGIVNSGHRRATAFVLRTVSPDGKEFEPRRFSTWAPMAIAGIGKLHGTIEDRSIKIELARRAPGEVIAPLDREARARLSELGSKLARWVADNAPAIRAADPPPIPALSDRANDNWRELRRIAAAIGGDWPARADAAARALSAERAEEDTLGTALLRDIREVFSERSNPDDLPASTLVEALVALEGRPWGEINRGRPLTTHRLARLLEPYRIFSTRTARARTYRRSQFLDAWSRYLGVAPSTSDTPFASPPPSLKASFRHFSSSDNGLEAVLKCHSTPLSDTLKLPVTHCDGTKNDGMTLWSGGTEGGKGESPPSGGCRSDVVSAEESPGSPVRRRPRRWELEMVAAAVLAGRTSRAAALASGLGIELTARQAWELAKAGDPAAVVAELEALAGNRG